MLVFEEKVNPEIRTDFIKKIKEVSSYLGIQPNWLMAVINFESNETFSGSVKNSITNAVGLIQFMPNTAESLGTTTFLLENMGEVAQLDYVKKYYTPYKSKITNFIDLYFATFFPIAIGKPLTYVLGTTNIPPSLIAASNPVFDINTDGKITKLEVENVIIKKIPEELRNLMFKTNKTSIVGVVVSLGLTAYLLKKLWD